MLGWRGVLFACFLVAWPIAGVSGAGADGAPAAAPPATGLSIPEDCRISYGQTGCPVFLINRDVYALPSLKKVCSLNTNHEFGFLAAISPDGKFGAAEIVTPIKGIPLGVETFDLRTGALLSFIPPKQELKAMALAGDGSLYLSSESFEQYNIKTGKLIRTMRLPPHVFPGRVIAVTADGRYLAEVTSDRPIVYNAATGAAVVTLNTPPVAPFNPARGPLFPPRQRVEDRFPVLFFDGVDRLAFSPDEKELATVTQPPSLPRLVIWKAGGQIAFTAAVNQKNMLGSVNPPQLNWSPDGSMLLVGSLQIIDPKSGRLLMFRPHGDGRSPTTFLDNNHLLIRLRNGINRLEPLTLPTAAVQKALADLNDPRIPAGLRPGGSLALRLDTTAIKGDATKVQQGLTNLFTNRLATDGFQINPASTAVLTAKYSEHIGASDFPKYEQFVAASLDLSITVSGSAQPVWADTVRWAADSPERGDSVIPALREKGVDELNLQFMVLPYFISAGPDAVALPAMIKQ